MEGQTNEEAVVEFSLLENALDSAETGLDAFYLANKEGKKRHYKRSLLDLFQAGELLLKAALARIDIKVIFTNNSLEKRCVNPQTPELSELYNCSSVNIKELCEQIKKHYPYKFSDKSLGLMPSLGTERNKLQHFGIQISPDHLKLLLMELYLEIYKPAFEIILEDETDINSWNSELKPRIIELEQHFLDIKIKDEYTLSMCPACESWSHFIIYEEGGGGIPIQSYCVCCDFSLQDLRIEDYHMCPECGAPGVIYIPERNAGACLWHKCYYNKEGGFVPMEPCECGEFRIEECCETCGRGEY